MTSAPGGLNRSRLSSWLWFQLRSFAGLCGAAVLTGLLYWVLRVAGDVSGSDALRGLLWLTLTAAVINGVILLVTTAVAVTVLLTDSESSNDS